MIAKLSDAEHEIMKLVWQNAPRPTLFAQLMEDLSRKGKDWQKNTLITLLGRLTNKGFLQKAKIGRKNEYMPIISEQEYNETQTRGFLKKYYGGSAAGLVSMLIQTDLLSEEEYAALRKELEEG